MWRSDRDLSLRHFYFYINGFPVCFISKLHFVAIFFTCFDFTQFCGTFYICLNKSKKIQNLVKKLLTKKILNVTLLADRRTI